jgi:hypothetical protein
MRAVLLDKAAAVLEERGQAYGAADAGFAAIAARWVDHAWTPRVGSAGLSCA